MRYLYQLGALAAATALSVASLPVLADDTQRPTVAIRAAKSALKNGETTVITFAVSEPVQNFDRNDVGVSHGVLNNFRKVNDYAYTASYTARTNGTGRLTIAAGAFSDMAWNQNTAAELSINIAATDTRDNVRPSLTIRAAETFLEHNEKTVITFSTSEAVQNFAANDVTVVNGTLSGFTKVTDNLYIATYTARGKGEGRISVAAGAFSDLSWNQNSASSLTLKIGDKTPPILNMSGATTLLAPGQSTTVTFRASEPIQNFAADDIVANNGRISNFKQVNSTTYSATFTADRAGGAYVSVGAGAFSDLSGNQNAANRLYLLVAADSGNHASYLLGAENQKRNGRNIQNQQGKNAQYTLNSVYEMLIAPLKPGDFVQLKGYGNATDGLSMRYYISDSKDKHGQVMERVAVRLNNGRYAIPQNVPTSLPAANSTARVNEFMTVARTYLNAGNKLHWNASPVTPLNTDKRSDLVNFYNRHGWYPITCSTYTAMVMAGWRFENTLYQTTKNTASYAWGSDFARPQTAPAPYGANNQLRWMYWGNRVAVHTPGTEDYRVGDLLFFAEQPKDAARDGFMNIFHVGIYIGNNQIMHSAGAYHGVGVVIENMGRYLQDTLVFIGRPNLN